MKNGKICPKCYGRKCTKNGIVKNKQRYRCKRLSIILQGLLVGNIQMKLDKKLLNFILKGVVLEE